MEPQALVVFLAPVARRAVCLLPPQLVKHKDNPMATNIWHESIKTIPKSDPQVIRIELDKNDIGARKSHLPTGTAFKNGNTIKHV